MDTPDKPWPFPDIPRPAKKAPSPLNPPTFDHAKIDADRDAVFVKEYLRLENRDDAAAVTAYRRAGFSEPQYPLSVAAERVLMRPDIQEAIARQRANFTTLLREDRSVESWMSDLDSIFESAVAAKDHSAAVNAKRAQAQVMGWMDQSLTVTHKVEVTQLSDEQLERIARRTPPLIESKARDVTPRGIGHLRTKDEQ